MTTLTIELPPPVYERLRAAATTQGQPIEAVAEQWLAEKSAAASDASNAAPQSSERDQASKALRAAGLLVEPQRRNVQRTPVSQAELAGMNERDRATAVLRAAGLLVEPTAEMRARAAQSTLTLEQAVEILDRAGGPPLSELIIEMRGPKE